MSPGYAGVAGMQVAQPLYDLVKDENALGTGVDPDFFGAFLARFRIN
jgi:hypothetical protein